jgi:hypothetical protein
MAANTATQQVSLDHPYKVPGILLVIISLVLVAFDVGYLESCGNGRGICIDWGTHRLGTAALVVFFIIFVIGVLLIVYTGASTTVTSVTTRVAPPTPPPSPPPVTVVSASPPPTTPTTVNVNPPRST